MDLSLCSVEKTRITISGEYPESVARQQFAKVMGDNPRISMIYELAETTGDEKETHLIFTPCQMLDVELDPVVAKRTGSTHSCQKRLKIYGTLPDDNLTEKWGKTRKRAYNKDSNVCWVVMMPPPLREKETDAMTGEVSTQINFIIEVRNEKKKKNDGESSKSNKKSKNDEESRGCPYELVEQTLKEAVRLAAICVSEIADQLQSPLMDPGGFMDQITINMAEMVGDYCLGIPQ